METNIKNNIEELSKGTYAATKEKNSNGFKNGAIVGFFSGALAGWFFRGKVITYGLIGLVAGGYVGYKISETFELKNDFSGFSANKFNLKDKYEL